MGSAGVRNVQPKNSSRAFGGPTGTVEILDLLLLLAKPVLEPLALHLRLPGFAEHRGEFGDDPSGFLLVVTLRKRLHGGNGLLHCLTDGLQSFVGLVESGLHWADSLCDPGLDRCTQIRGFLEHVLELGPGRCGSLLCWRRWRGRR
jgi:hypothetical protein